MAPNGSVLLSYLPPASQPDRLHSRKGDSVNIERFFREDDGQGLVEYALIIAVIAIAVIVAMIFLRGQIQNIFSNIGNNLT
jgi:pilus assembly protein Flp/PilA